MADRKGFLWDEIRVMRPIARGRHACVVTMQLKEVPNPLMALETLEVPYGQRSKGQRD